VRLWDDPDHAGLSGAALSPDGSKVALLPGSGRFQVKRATDGKLLLDDTFQDRVLKVAQFSADGGTLMASGLAVPSLRLYDTATWKPTRTIVGVGNKRVLLTAKGWIVFAAYTAKVVARPPSPATGPAVLISPIQAIDASLSHDGTRGILLGKGGELMRLRDGAPPTIDVLRTDRAVVAVAISGDARRIAAARVEDIHVTGLGPGQGSHVIPLSAERIIDLALSPTGRYVATGELRGRARIWRVSDATLVGDLRGHERRVAGVSFAQDGMTLLTGSWDGSARLWDLSVLRRPVAELRAEILAAWPLTLQQAMRSPTR